MYSFTFNVICDESIIDAGAPVLQSVDFSNECAPEVTYMHAAGCYQAPIVEVVEEPEVEIIYETIEVTKQEEKIIV